jgi:uncharacterized HAD superfamily protein
VKRARRILDSPEKWNRADTRQCPPDAKTFSLYCALEKATDDDIQKLLRVVEERLSRHLGQQPNN